MRRRDPDLLRLLKFEKDECELCGGVWHLHLHHVLFRSQGGDDVRANIVCLCRGCHEQYHANQNRGEFAAYIASGRPDVVEYLVEKHENGKDGVAHWFDVHWGRHNVV